MVLEWTERHAYVLTELIFFIITILILFSTVIVIFIILLLYFRKKSTFFYLLRPLFENVFTSAIAFSKRKNDHIKIVFLGNIQRDFKKDTKESPVTQKKFTNSAARLWVHIYFTLLCCVTILWFATVFSDAVLYRKTGTCLDMDVRDSSARCFLLSTADPPPEIQAIIDEEEGETVPCQRVQNYLISYNSTYNLEVICYIQHLSPLPALGIAYGTMKAMTFGIIFALTGLFAVFSKITKCIPKSRKPKMIVIIIAHVVQILLSVVIIAVIIGIVSGIHESSSRNTSFDFLRGERFYHSSVVTLGSVTILITFGLFPWWAFEPLEKSFELKPSKNPAEGIELKAKNLTKEDETRRNEVWNDDLAEKVHHMILLHQFSIDYRESAQ